MKVAIIGAGVSGLSCAFEFEKNGITPVIFEKRHRIGDPSGYSGIWSKLIIRVQADPLNYLKNKYNLDLKPLSIINKTIIKSPNRKTNLEGYMGYTMKRGIEDYSLENQIASKIKSSITFNTKIELDNIRNEFDHIIIATSNPSIPKKLYAWMDTFVAQARVAIVVGDFMIDTVRVWLNEKYSNKAFCYLIPNNSKEATLVLTVNGNSISDLDYYWNKFMEVEQIKYTITEQNDVEHFCGFVSPLQIENLYFVGNTAGFTDDLIGVGAFNAIESGILAAQAIINNKDYDKTAKHIFDDIVKLHEFRKAMNNLNNNGFDNLVSFINIPGIKQFINKNPLLKLHHGTPIIKLYNNIKKNE